MKIETITKQSAIKTGQETRKGYGQARGASKAQAITLISCCGLTQQGSAAHTSPFPVGWARELRKTKYNSQIEMQLFNKIKKRKKDNNYNKNTYI